MDSIVLWGEKSTLGVKIAIFCLKVYPQPLYK